MKGNDSLRSLALLAFMAILVIAAMRMPDFGSPPETRMDDHFIEKGQEETGSNNIVAAILFDYRGLDTLGEASVLFAAAGGAFLLFRRRAG